MESLIHIRLHLNNINRDSGIEIPEARMPTIGHHSQCAKKVMSDILGLVDFAIRLVILVLNLPEGQVLFFGESQITEGL